MNSDGHLRQKSRTVSGRKPSVVREGASTTHIKRRGHRIIDKIKGNIESLRRISHLLGELCSYSGVSRIIIQDLQSLVTQLSIEQLPRDRSFQGRAISSQARLQPICVHLSIPAVIMTLASLKLSLLSSSWITSSQPLLFYTLPFKYHLHFPYFPWHERVPTVLSFICTAIMRADEGK